MYLQTEVMKKSRPTSDWKEANQSNAIHSSNYHRDNYSWTLFYFTETDFIHDFTTIPLIFCTRYRIDGITGMSHGISEGKQKKKLLIPLKAVEFFYSLKTKWWFNSHTKWTVRVSSSFNPRRTCKFIPAPWYRGSWWTPPPQSFWFVAVFRNAFDLVYKMKVYFMGGGAAGGLCRHQQWSPPWPPSWILLRIKNRLKPRKMATFCALDEK